MPKSYLETPLLIRSQPQLEMSDFGQEESARGMPLFAHGVRTGAKGRRWRRNGPFKQLLARKSLIGHLPNVARASLVQRNE